jgi:hypothetical protein
MIPGKGPAYAVHAVVALGGTPLDVPMNLNIGTWPDIDQNYALRAQFGISPNSDATTPFVPPCSGTAHMGNARAMELRLPWGVRLRNEEILDPRSGFGIATRVWGSDPWIVYGQRPVEPERGALSFIAKLLAHPGFFGPDWLQRPEVAEIRRRLENGQAYLAHGPHRRKEHVKLIAIQSRGTALYFESSVDDHGRWIDAPPRLLTSTIVSSVCGMARVAAADPATPARAADPREHQNSTELTRPLLGRKED